MRIEQFDKFSQRIHNSAKQNGFPLRAMFELTYRCNFSCRHCYIPKGYKYARPELKTKEVFFIIDQLASLGCVYLGFTGGEPFIRKDIIKILKHAKKRGFQVIIYTNGSLINKRIAAELIRLQPNKVDITIPAMSKTALEQISGVSGSKEKIFKAIEVLHKGGISLGFKTCLLKENASEIKKIQDFSASLNAFHRLDTMLSPRLDGSKTPYKYRGTLKTALRNQLNASWQRNVISCGLAKTESLSKESNREQIFKCGAGLSQLAITPAGELKLCLMIDYPGYRIMDTSLEDSWSRLKDLIKNIKIDQNYRCPQCKLKQYCKWCPAQSWAEKRNFISCNPESKSRAKIIKEEIAERLKTSNQSPED